MLPAANRSSDRLGGRVVLFLIMVGGLVWTLPTLRGDPAQAQQEKPDGEPQQSTRVDKAAPRASAAKAGPRPRELSPEEREAIQEWWQMTSLTEGEILKRIAPPFPECRAVAYRAMRREFGSHLPVPDVMCIRQTPDPVVSHGYDHVGHTPLSFVVDSLLEMAVERQEIEGDPELLNSPIDGDWIVRESIPVENVLPRLEEILRKECKLPVKLRFDQAEREVIVVKGTYQLAPTSDRKAIRVYGKVLTERPGGGGSGTFEEFVRTIGNFLHRRIVSEVASAPEGRIQWRYNSPFPKIEGWNDRNEDSVLTHLSEQTGLVFVNEKRKVPALFVDRAE
jgi:hypothetical protein